MGSWRNADALITGEDDPRWQAHFQIVDVVASMKPLTNLSQQIVSASSIATVVQNAFRIAMEERPGPVHGASGRCRGV